MKFFPFLFLFLAATLWTSSASASAPKKIPNVHVLKEELRREFGIIALDRTDEHSPVVLENLLFLLRHAFSPELLRELKNVRYIFAYAGHDRSFDLAAYHVQAKAISIAGKTAYSDEEGGVDLQLLSTLAHEIGHAFLFQKLSPADLQLVSTHFGGWSPAFHGIATDFYAQDFLSPHPEQLRSQNDIPFRKKFSLTSQLATKNVHEWFADAFAAAALRRLGERGLLGGEWQKKIVIPAIGRRYWSDYNNISSSLLAWIDSKMAGKSFSKK